MQVASHHDKSKAWQVDWIYKKIRKSRRLSFMKLTSCKDQLQCNQLVLESVSTPTSTKPHLNFNPSEKNIRRKWKKSAAIFQKVTTTISTNLRNVRANENYLPINPENGTVFSNHIMPNSPRLQVNQPDKQATQKLNYKARLFVHITYIYKE